MRRVDIGIPCYKYGHYLEECVRSVLTQEGVDVRVLIVDDASPDNSELVGRRLASEDPRVEYRRHAVNQGPSASYNEPIDWADAEYFLVLSADDLLTPGALGRVVTLMEAHADVVMAYGRVIHLRGAEDRPPCPPPRTFETRVVSGSQFCEESCAKVANLVFTPTAVVRTSQQKAIGPYRKDLPHTGDMDMWFRCAARGSIGFIDADQAYYRVHGQNMSTVQYVGATDLNQQWVVFEELFRTQGHRLGNPELLDAHVRQDLAWRAFWMAGDHFERGERAACDECIALAVRLWPDVRRTGAWLRFVCKSAVGPHAWSRLRPAVDALRGRRVRETSPMG